jgi:hypothetical protein
MAATRLDPKSGDVGARLQVFRHIGENSPRAVDGPVRGVHILQWIGLRENLQERPIFHGKIYGFL